MKRKQNFPRFVFVKKIPRVKISEQQSTKGETSTSSAVIDGGNAGAKNDVKTVQCCDKADAIPDCWSNEQYDNFRKKYDGLIVRNKKLGCKHCAKFDSLNMKGYHVSKEWKNCNIAASGRNKVIQQASLRKKMSEHFSSKAHNICFSRLQDCAADQITKCMEAFNHKHIESTCRVFNTVYSLAKQIRPFSDIADEVEQQIKNGVDMGLGLHSRKTAVKIVYHIAREIKSELFAKIIEQNKKICIIIDEVSTISSKSVLVIFVKVEDEDLSPTIFLDLVELESQGADQIYYTMLDSLNSAGFSNEYLKQNLIGFCADGASVMLGRNSGVGIRLQNDFPNIVIWHCLNHRLQLVLDDSVNDIEQVNHFKIFMDNIYSIFHKSNKSQKELFNISEELGQEISKIGRVLGPRWASCSLRSAVAVWRAYPSLYKYFSSSTKYSGMTASLCNKNFLKDLALMIDILKEISLLSNALQARGTTLFRGENLLERSIKAFELLKDNIGTFEKEIDEKVASDAFKEIQFTENHRFVSLPRQKLLEAIIENMKKRLIADDHAKATSNEQENFLELFNLLDQNTWNVEEVLVPWVTAEKKLGRLNEFLHHEVTVNDFRDFVENVLSSNGHVPQSVKRAKNIIDTIAISSAEAERGFSLMNIIYTDKRGRLLLKNVANLMVISLIGLPLNLWDPTPVVKTWLRKNHSADDNRVKNKKTKGHDPNQLAIWKLLK